MSSNNNSENNPPQITNQPEKSDKIKSSQEKKITPEFDPEKFKSADNCNHCKNCKCPCHHWHEMREKMKGENRGMRGEHRGMFRGRGMFGRGRFGHFPMFPPWMMHRGGFGRGHPPPPTFEGDERGRGRGRGHHHHPPFHFWGPPPRPRNHSNDHYNEYDYGYGNYENYDMYDEGYDEEKSKNEKKDNNKK